MYGEACLNEKNVSYWADLFKESQSSIPSEDHPTIESTPEMVDSVNAFILDDRGVTTEDISKELGISLGTAHITVHDDLTFSKVICHWVSSGQLQGLIRLLEQWKPSVNLVGNSCNILLIVQIYFLLISACPVGWICRIHWLHLCRGVRPPHWVFWLWH